jgi:hypothetical protein
VSVVRVVRQSPAGMDVSTGALEDPLWKGGSPYLATTSEDYDRLRLSVCYSHL